TNGYPINRQIARLFYSKNHIDQAISDLLELSKGAFDIWFQHYQEKLKLMLIENISDGDKKQSNAKSTITEKPELVPESNTMEPRVRKQSLVNCAEIMSKAQLDFGTRQSDAGSIENCLMTLRTELNHLGK
ncbi:hypothetical protein HUJ04_010348, partial [Dendroctonus ponderosae]